jgi:translation initiation factor 3 subunit J
MRHAEDLFSEIGVPATRKGTTPGTAIVIDPRDPTKTIDFTKMKLFNPSTKAEFENLRTNVAPVIAELSKKPHYMLFLQEFAKELAKNMPSEQIKKVASTLTTLSNEKMKEEKAADKGGKKSKAQKTKTSLVTNRANAIEVNAYEEETFGEYVGLRI